jgi:dynein heavy chain
LSLTPQKGGGGDAGAAGGDTKLIADLKERVPEIIDIWALKHKLKGDDNPLNVVLVQEIGRYNDLLKLLVLQLDQLEKGIKGLVVISPHLEAILNSLQTNKIPVAWSFAYFSLKPL